MHNPESLEKFVESLKEGDQYTGLAHYVSTIKSVQDYGFVHVLEHLDKPQEEIADTEYLCAFRQLDGIGTMLVSLSREILKLAAEEPEARESKAKEEEVFNKLTEMITSSVKPNEDLEKKEKLTRGCRDAAEILGLTAMLFNTMSQHKTEIQVDHVVEILKRTGDAMYASVENVEKLR